MRRAPAVTNASFSLEHQCPQCGAPVSLEETDRIFMCPYCHVRHFLHSPGYFRYYLPPLQNNAGDVLYIPYWRFKGLKITIQSNMTKRDIVDRSLCSIPCKGVSPSLGFRTQTLTMRFVEPETPGQFLPPAMQLGDFLKTLETNIPAPVNPGKRVVEQSISMLFVNGVAVPDMPLPEITETVSVIFIGEVVSCIWAPFFIRETMLFDGISGAPLGPAQEEWSAMFTKRDGAAAVSSGNASGGVYKTDFIPALCPKCGWNLQGDRQSCMLVCGQCLCAFEPSKQRLAPIEFSVSWPISQAGLWLPFWRITVECSNAQFSSIADFYRFAGIPRPIRPADEKRTFYFWVPAFKSNPDFFFKLGKLFTLQFGEIERPLAAPSPLYPVTLPAEEAFQSIPALLVEAAPARKRIIPLIKTATFSLKSSSLVFVPFVDRGSELIQSYCNIAVNKNALRVGKGL